MKDTEHTLAQDQLLAELGWIRALAYRLVTDPNVADDVLQRVCLVALEKPPRNVTGMAGIRRWLSTLTRRTAAHAQRADGRRARRERRAAQDEALPPTVDLAERREVMHHLVDALADLEPGDRELLTLRYFEGAAIGDIAGRLDLSGAAVRQRLSRARGRLRDRLEGDAGSGPDREHWLAALGPVAHAPIAHLITASRAELVREAAQTTLSHSFGVAAMTKVISSLSLKVAVGMVAVAVAVVGTWKALDPGGGEALQPLTVLRPAAAHTPEAEPTTLPVVPKATTDEPRVLTIAPDPEAVSPEDPESDVLLPPSGLQTALDEATVSFVTLDPDLQALNDVLRQLAFAAHVVPDSVSKDPSDGSINGWVEIDGTDLKAQWSRDESGRYQVKFGMLLGDYPDPFVARDLGIRFSDDRGYASDVKTYVDFHPNTSEKNFASLLASLNEGVKPVGWHLSVGPQGTTGTPSTMRMSDDGDSVIITAQEAGIPSFTEGWANDTSPYDLWLALLAGATP